MPHIPVQALQRRLTAALEAEVAWRITNSQPPPPSGSGVVLPSDTERVIADTAASYQTRRAGGGAPRDADLNAMATELAEKAATIAKQAVRGLMRESRKEVDMLKCTEAEDAPQRTESDELLASLLIQESAPAPDSVTTQQRHTIKSLRKLKDQRDLDRKHSASIAKAFLTQRI